MRYEQEKINPKCSLLIDDEVASNNVTVCVFCEEFKVEGYNGEDRENYFSHLEDRHGVRVNNKHELRFIFNKYFINCLKYFGTAKKPTTTSFVRWFQDNYPNDAKFRENLKILQLQQLLSHHENERTQTNFKRKCFICEKKITGNRKNLLTHLMGKHRICLGDPDNIVNVNEFLDLLENYISAGKCFHCGGKFINIRAHLNYENQPYYLKPFKAIKDFDRFYLINHIELGKCWLDFENPYVEPEGFEETEVIKFSGWEENQSCSLCLFCNFKCNGVENVFSHMVEVHKFNFVWVTSQIDFYEKVKVINYIRRVVAYFKNQPDCDHLWDRTQKIVSTIKKLIYEKSNWRSNDFLQPLLENDALIICQNESKYRISLEVGKEVIDVHSVVSSSCFLPEITSDSFSDFKSNYSHAQQPCETAASSKCFDGACSSKYIPDAIRRCSSCEYIYP